MYICGILVLFFRQTYKIEPPPFGTERTQREVVTAVLRANAGNKQREQAFPACYVTRIFLRKLGRSKHP